MEPGHTWATRLLTQGEDSDIWAVADQAVTFGELRSEVRKHSDLLAQHGVNAGTSVALCLPPSLTLMYVMLAAWCNGAQVMLIDARTPPAEKNRMVSLCSPHFLLTGAPPRDTSSYLLPDVPFKVEPGPAQMVTDPDVCLVQFSSGSTGLPKVIGRTSGALLAELGRYAALDGMPRSGERVLLLNSVIHTMGLVGGILHGLNSAVTMVFPASLRPHDLFQAAVQNEVNAVLGVPLHYALMTAAPGKFPTSLRLAVSAGERLPTEVWEKFVTCYGLPVSPVYGTTESGLISADLRTGCSPPDVGVAVDGIEVDVRDSELYVRLPSSPYLWTDRDDRYCDGWLRTFDRFDRDENTGRLTFRGRSDSVVAIGGLKVDLTEVEAALNRHPKVRESVVVFGKTMEAYVGTDLQLSEADLITWCRRELAEFKIPKRFYISDEVPRNFVGKIIRNESLLKEHWGASAGTDR